MTSNIQVITEYPQNIDELVNQEKLRNPLFSSMPLDVFDNINLNDLRTITKEQEESLKYYLRQSIYSNKISKICNKLLNNKETKYFKEKNIPLNEQYLTSNHQEATLELVLELIFPLTKKQNHTFSFFELCKIAFASANHDIGKNNVDTGILIKNSKLSKNEMGQIVLHPQHGAGIIWDFFGDSYINGDGKNKLEFYHDVCLIVEGHHLRYDMKGYPECSEELLNKLKTPWIRLSHDILTVVDSYDVMNRPRPYSEAKSSEYIMKELKKYSGSQFNPKIVDVFLSMINLNYSLNKFANPSKDSLVPEIAYIGLQ